MSGLHRGEQLGLAVLAALAVVLCAYQFSGRVEIAWDAFVSGFILYGIIMGFGFWFRLFGRFPRLSATLIALGFYPIYASLLALVTYMQFPFQRPLIDPLLLRIDAALGYDWVAGVTWLADYPAISQILARVYVSALPQLAILLLVLGLSGRVMALHRLLLTGMIAGIGLVVFWTLFPSFGPAAFLVLDPEVAARARVLVSNEYGAELMRLAEEGIGRVEKHQLLGTVAFPSFHIVMGILAFWFARGTWLVWPTAVTGMLMVPATALHGGHHAVDLIGGGILFALALAITRQLLPADQVITSGAARPVRAAIPASASTAAMTGARTACGSPSVISSAKRSR